MTAGGPLSNSKVVVTPGIYRKERKRHGDSGKKIIFSARPRSPRPQKPHVNVQYRSAVRSNPPILGFRYILRFAIGLCGRIGSWVDERAKTKRVPFERECPRKPQVRVGTVRPEASTRAGAAASGLFMKRTV